MNFKRSVRAMLWLAWILLKQKSKNKVEAFPTNE